MGVVPRLTTLPPSTHYRSLVHYYHPSLGFELANQGSQWRGGTCVKQHALSGKWSLGWELQEPRGLWAWAFPGGAMEWGGCDQWVRFGGAEMAHTATTSLPSPHYHHLTAAISSLHHTTATTSLPSGGAGGGRTCASSGAAPL